VAASCRRSNENSVTIKYREFRDYLKNCQFLKEDSAPWSYLFIYLFNCILPVYFLIFALVSGLLARSQYPEDPATGHLSTAHSLRHSDFNNSSVHSSPKLWLINSSNAI
jgi:hypothetical protein